MIRHIQTNTARRWSAVLMLISFTVFCIAYKCAQRFSSEHRDIYCLYIESNSTTKANVYFDSVKIYPETAGNSGLYLIKQTEAPAWMGLSIYKNIIIWWDYSLGRPPDLSGQRNIVFSSLWSTTASAYGMSSSDLLERVREEASARDITDLMPEADGACKRRSLVQYPVVICIVAMFLSTVACATSLFYYLLCALRNNRRKRNCCEVCGYPVSELRICPECGCSA